MNFPLLKGILLTTETQARHFGEKTAPLKCSFFQSVCVFVV